MGYEPVIVFPQGKFSVAALQALSYSSIVGAINTTLFAVDVSDSYHFTNLLSPFSIKSGFPILKRFYPDNLLGKAFSLLLDRPVVFAEHHSFFRTGYSEFSSLFSIPGVNWVNPACLFKKFHQTRMRPDQETAEVRFFSKEFLFENNIVSEMIHFQTAVMAETVGKVLVNGRSVVYETDGEVIHFCARKTPGESLEIQICGTEAPLFPKYRREKLKEIRILFRRKASELRDNFLCKSELLETMYSTIRNTLRRS